MPLHRFAAIAFYRYVGLCAGCGARAVHIEPGAYLVMPPRNENGELVNGFCVLIEEAADWSRPQYGRRRVATGRKEVTGGAQDGISRGRAPLGG
jgi:hypothetical protein